MAYLSNKDTLCGELLTCLTFKLQDSKLEPKA